MVDPPCHPDQQADDGEGQEQHKQPDREQADSNYAQSDDDRKQRDYDTYTARIP